MCTIAFLVLVFDASVVRGQANTNLVIEGSVVGYELYLVKPMLGPLMHPMLVKVLRVVEGGEKSQYIIVNRNYLGKENAEKEFGRDNKATFRLVRQPYCNRRIRSLFHPGLTERNGVVVKTDQTFTVVDGFSKRKLPLEIAVPCYVLASEALRSGKELE